MGTSARRRSIATAAGFTIGVILGYVVGLGIRSDNLPFFAALGAAIGLCIGLAIGLALDRGHVAVGQDKAQHKAAPAWLASWVGKNVPGSYQERTNERQTHFDSKRQPKRKRQ